MKIEGQYFLRQSSGKRLNPSENSVLLFGAAGFDESFANEYFISNNVVLFASKNFTLPLCGICALPGSRSPAC